MKWGDKYTDHWVRAALVGILVPILSQCGEHTPLIDANARNERDARNRQPELSPGPERSSITSTPSDPIRVPEISSGGGVQRVPVGGGRGLGTTFGTSGHVTESTENAATAAHLVGRPDFPYLHPNESAPVVFPERGRNGVGTISLTADGKQYVVKNPDGTSSFDVIDREEDTLEPTVATPSNAPRSERNKERPCYHLRAREGRKEGLKVTRVHENLAFPFIKAIRYQQINDRTNEPEDFFLFRFINDGKLQKTQPSAESGACVPWSELQEEKWVAYLFTPQFREFRKYKGTIASADLWFEESTQGLMLLMQRDGTLPWVRIPVQDQASQPLVAQTDSKKKTIQIWRTDCTTSEAQAIMGIIRESTAKPGSSVDTWFIALPQSDDASKMASAS